MARLPVPGSDTNVWGKVLNDFLGVELNADGSLKKSALINGAEQTSNKGQANGYASLNGSVQIPAAQLSDATSTSKGVLQLGGDLAGTAAAPTVPALTNKVAKNELVLDVKDFGAKGDGTTNDTTAIQSAIDTAFGAGGGIVFVPPATYIISPTGLQVKSNVTLRGSGSGTVFKVANGTNTSGNIVKVESWSNVVLADFCVDGNRANQSSGTNYGVYVAASANCKVENLQIRNMTGVGLQVYNSDGVLVQGCTSQTNAYHGFEAEQVRGCILHGNRGTANDLHGLLISPGEVSGTGSVGNSFIGNTFDSNSQYGICSNAANGDVSAWLNKGNLIEGNQVYGNQQYGIQIYKQDNNIISGNFIYNNKFFGIFLYQSQNNAVQGNILYNNSQQGNGAYDEILLEGWTDNNAHPSNNNDISHNTILILGGIKARWAVNEATANDSPNIITYNNTPVAGTAGTINRLGGATIVSNPAGVLQVYGIQSIQGANAGLDNAFNGVMRIYNNFVNGETQVVTPNGPTSFYVGGPKRFEIDTAGHIRMAAPASVPSMSDNGSISFYLDESGNNLKVAVRYSNGTAKTGTIALV
ncbi:MAG TPA: right-handed parallel beta-helix repeat-containing protein [Patescibacteria group bacterium]|nr:right-handed parallel beta-helix repeat-containing protein [Patescibacteria group bacterium]